MVELDPKVVVWEYTLRCNSKCLHCGSDAVSSRSDELSFEEALDLVNQISNIGFKLVVLSGGEPTLRKDWFRTTSKIREEEMEVGIISNALAWKPETIDNLVALNPYAVGLSVDGEAELHDYLRGVQGSHKKVFNSIRELKRRNTTVCVVTSVNKRNLEELPQIRNRLIVYGVDAWQLQVASPMGRMADNRDLVLDARNYHRFGEFIIETRQRLPYMNVQAGDCVGYFGTLEAGIRDKEWAGCMAGIESIGIESDGTVKGCLSMQTPKANEGNIRDRTLREIWEDITKFKYNRQFDISDLKGDCVDCDYGAKCRAGCQSQSIAFFDEFHNAPYCLQRHEKSIREK